MDTSGLGKILVGAGVLLVLVGLLFLGLGRLTGGQGWRLPGDIVYRRDNVTIYVPLATSILISVLLTVMFYIVSVVGRR